MSGGVCMKGGSCDACVVVVQLYVCVVILCAGQVLCVNKNIVCMHVAMLVLCVCVCMQGMLVVVMLCVVLVQLYVCIQKVVCMHMRGVSGCDAVCVRGCRVGPLSEAGGGQGQPPCSVCPERGSCQCRSRPG